MPYQKHLPLRKMLQQLFILLLGLLSQFTPLEIEGDAFLFSSEKECAELVVLGKAADDLAGVGRNADDALEAIVSPLRGGGKYTDDVLDELKRAFPDEASLKKIVDEDLVESWSLSTTLNLSEINSVQLLERFSELTKNTNFKDFISRFIREDTWSWSDKMSKFDEVCIKYWTTKAGYKDFNNALINGESLSQFSLSYKTSLLEALSKLENHIIPSGGSLSRGTVINLQDFNSKYFKGNEFPESFFTATSKNHETAEGFMLRRMDEKFNSIEKGDAVPVFFRIKGNVGKDISRSSLAKEGEVLFPPGSRRKVLDVKDVEFYPDEVLDIHGVDLYDMINDLSPPMRKYKVVTFEIID